MEVIGSLRTSKYTDQTGQERSNQSIVINSISSLQAVKKQNGYNTPYDYNTGSFNQKADQQVINDFLNLDSINDDDLPF